jgi:hypothetical protein
MHVHPKTLGLEERAGRAWASKKIKRGGQGGSPWYPSCVGNLADIVAIDEGACPCVGEEELDPHEETGPRPKAASRTAYQELPDDGVVGLVESS